MVDDYLRGGFGIKIDFYFKKLKGDRRESCSLFGDCPQGVLHDLVSVIMFYCLCRVHRMVVP